MPLLPGRKWVRRLAIAAVILVVGVVVVRTVLVGGLQSRLAGTIARIEADDPDWRLDKLIAARNAALPPDDRNSFPLAAGVKAKLPATFDDRTTPLYEAMSRQPNALLRPEDLTALNKLLAECGPALADARKLATMPDGGQPLVIPPNPMMINLTGSQDVRRAAGLLHLDAVAAANANKPADAVRSARALLNAGRAIGDEPTLISQLVRVACVAVAGRTVAEVLGLCEPTDTDGLAELHAELLREADFRRLTVGFRGERALSFQTFDWMMSNGPGAPAPTGIPILDPIARWGMRTYLPADQLRCLELMTEFVAASKKPFEEQRAALAAVPRPGPNEWRYNLTRMMVPAVEKVAEAGLRSRGELLAVATGVAAERYRRKHGAWPASLEALVPEFLPAVPLDPFTGRPLGFKPLPDGLVIYTVGPDGKDGGGQVLDTPDGPRATDYGIRLWTKDQRRQPPAPAPASPAPGGIAP
ncbi:MAG: hypothetical protein U0871_11265 [Gemmataceae bacterium]